jgi:hypothetical protein
MCKYLLPFFIAIKGNNQARTIISMRKTSHQSWKVEIDFTTRLYTLKCIRGPDWGAAAHRAISLRGGGPVLRRSLTFPHKANVKFLGGPPGWCPPRPYGQSGPVYNRKDLNNEGMLKSQNTDKLGGSSTQKVDFSVLHFKASVRAFQQRVLIFSRQMA